MGGRRPSTGTALHRASSINRHGSTADADHLQAWPRRRAPTLYRCGPASERQPSTDTAPQAGAVLLQTRFCRRRLGVVSQPFIPSPWHAPATCGTPSQPWFRPGGIHWPCGLAILPSLFLICGLVDLFHHRHSTCLKVWRRAAAAVSRRGAHYSMRPLGSLPPPPQCAHEDMTRRSAKASPRGAHWKFAASRTSSTAATVLA